MLQVSRPICMRGTIASILAFRAVGLPARGTTLRGVRSHVPQAVHLLRIQG
jgi:hypothetical protein